MKTILTQTFNHSDRWVKYFLITACALELAVLALVLKLTSTSFDSTEIYALVAMGVVATFIHVLGWSFWKTATKALIDQAAVDTCDYILVKRDSKDGA